MDEKFNVVQFFTDDKYEYVRKAVSVEEASKAFAHYTNSLAVKMGMVNRVIITDMLDCINAEWIAGKGLVYPKPEDLKV